MSPDYMSPDRQHRLALPRNDEDPYQIGPSGRELDALVAEKVFGAIGRTTAYAWADRKRREFPCIVFMGGANGEHYSQPGLSSCYDTLVTSDGEKLSRGVYTPLHFSTRIQDAWQVVEHMRGRGWNVALDDVSGDGDCPFWCEFAKENYEHGGQAWESTWPLAICKAALAAMRPQPGA